MYKLRQVLYPSVQSWTEYFYDGETTVKDNIATVKKKEHRDALILRGFEEVVEDTDVEETEVKDTENLTEDAPEEIDASENSDTADTDKEVQDAAVEETVTETVVETEAAEVANEEDTVKEAPKATRSTSRKRNRTAKE